jgi:hypothetical protein
VLARKRGRIGIRRPPLSVAPHSIDPADVRA